MTLKMKGALIFLFVSLAIFSTIEAQEESRKTTCLLKSRGKTWTVRNTPARCCNRRGYLSFKRGFSFSGCQILCPLFKALRGCDYMCHWPMCSLDTDHDHCQCKTLCEKKTVPSVECGETEIDLDIFHPLGRTPCGL